MNFSRVSRRLDKYFEEELRRLEPFADGLVSGKAGFGALARGIFIRICDDFDLSRKQQLIAKRFFKTSELTMTGTTRDATRPSMGVARNFRPRLRLCTLQSRPDGLLFEASARSGGHSIHPATELLLDSAAKLQRRGPAPALFRSRHSVQVVQARRALATSSWTARSASS